MREIKFRAWDAIENKMVYWTLNDLLVRFNTSDYDGDDQPSVFFDWMQYTGLKDRNGMEIYESDIMKTESGICIVIWYEKGACFRWLFNENSESPLNYDDREVIGNIHENPELLSTTTGSELGK